MPRPKKPDLGAFGLSGDPPPKPTRAPGSRPKVPLGEPAQPSASKPEPDGSGPRLDAPRREAAQGRLAERFNPAAALKRRLSGRLAGGVGRAARIGGKARAARTGGLVNATKAQIKALAKQTARQGIKKLAMTCFASLWCGLIVAVVAVLLSVAILAGMAVAIILLGQEATKLGEPVDNRYDAELAEAETLRTRRASRELAELAEGELLVAVRPEDVALPGALMDRASQSGWAVVAFDSLTGELGAAAQRSEAILQTPPPPTLPPDDPYTGPRHPPGQSRHPPEDVPAPVALADSDNACGAAAGILPDSGRLAVADLRGGETEPVAALLAHPQRGQLWCRSAAGSVMLWNRTADDLPVVSDECAGGCVEMTDTEGEQVTVALPGETLQEWGTLALRLTTALRTVHVAIWAEQTGTEPPRICAHQPPTLQPPIPEPPHTADGFVLVRFYDPCPQPPECPDPLDGWGYSYCAEPIQMIRCPPADPAPDAVPHPRCAERWAVQLNPDDYPEGHLDEITPQCGTPPWRIVYRTDPVVGDNKPTSVGDWCQFVVVDWQPPEPEPEPRPGFGQVAAWTRNELARTYRSDTVELWHAVGAALDLGLIRLEDHQRVRLAQIHADASAPVGQEPPTATLATWNDLLTASYAVDETELASGGWIGRTDTSGAPMLTCHWLPRLFLGNLCDEPRQAARDGLAAVGVATDIIPHHTCDTAEIEQKLRSPGRVLGGLDLDDPTQLVEIPEAWGTGPGHYVAPCLLTTLEHLLAASAASMPDGPLKIVSAYRSVATQAGLRQARGCDPDLPPCPGTAPAGRSMHQTGQAVDFATGSGRIIDINTPPFDWLQEVLPPAGLFNLAGTVPEGWHWSTNAR